MWCIEPMVNYVYLVPLEHRWDTEHTDLWTPEIDFSRISTPEGLLGGPCHTLKHHKLLKEFAKVNDLGID